jgi:hypothetical protein
MRAVTRDIGVLQAALVIVLSLGVVLEIFTPCVVGPTYVKPTVPMSPGFKESPPESFKESDGWRQRGVISTMWAPNFEP